MCGRFTLTATPVLLQELFPLLDLMEVPPRYNIAPSQSIVAVRQLAEKDSPEWANLRWGLVPSWADDIMIGYKLLNARAETVATKPAFRTAFQRRRCLVPADGFYEWRKEGKAKHAHYIQMASAKPFVFAGLWEEWHAPDGEVVESCTLLTTEANELMKTLHDRMPVILAPGDHDLWLDPKVQRDPRLQELLRPFPAGEMTARPVGDYVNNARHEGPECLQ